MRVLYHIPYPHGLGADRWIYEAWREGFLARGHEFHLFRDGERLAERVHAIEPDVFLTFINILDYDAERATLQRIRARGTKVLMGVYWPLEPRVPPARIETFRREDLADIYFGEREPEQMARFEDETGKRYHVIPNAANPRMHFPVAPVRRYAYDIVYLGANLRKKRWFAENILQPLRRKYRVGVFGPGWSVQDTMLRACSKACKLARAYPVARMIDRARVSIPPDAERLLYSSAKISLNFHEREDDGSQPHYIVNQRTFKIPACGGFQLCDHVPAIWKYFREDEMVLASLDRAEWLEKIEYFLHHETEREEIRRRGTRRALDEHMSTNRVDALLSLLIPR